MATPSDTYAIDPPESIRELWRAVHVRFPASSITRQWLRDKLSDYYAQRKRARLPPLILSAESNLEAFGNPADFPNQTPLTLTAAIYDAYPAGEPIYSCDTDLSAAGYHAVNCSFIRDCAANGLGERALAALAETVEAVSGEAAAATNDKRPELLERIDRKLLRRTDLSIPAANARPDTDDGEPTKRDGEAKPKVYLHGWPELLDALGLKNNDSDKSKVRYANEKYQGPILIAGQGSKPKAEKTKLLDWWDRLEAQYEMENRTRDAKASVADTYLHGHDAEVVPGIAGSVKRRRNKE